MTDERRISEAWWWLFCALVCFVILALEVIRHARRHGLLIIALAVAIGAASWMMGRAGRGGR